MSPFTQALVVLGIISMANAFDRDSASPPRLRAAEIAPDSATTAAEATQAFSANLYRELAKEHAGQNLFFSPHSIALALSMVAEGARGDTAVEMGTVLAWPEALRRPGPHTDDRPWNTASVHAGLAQLSQRFELADAPYRLSIANAVWADRGCSLNPSFIETIDRAYQTGGVRVADFQNNPDGERERINRWVQEQTADRIRELVKQGRITPDTALVLANAIYFKGNWARPFDPRSTRPQAFRRQDGSTVTVPMMSQTAQFPFASVKLAGQAETSLEMVELNYEGDQLSMLLMMPSEPGQLSTLEGQLTPTNLKAWSGRLAALPCQVSLPKFKLQGDYSLVPALSNLGMPSAFGTRADFGGMTSEPSALSISDVLHQAVVEVDEQGTEAAAATAVIMKRGRVFAFVADRPFLLLIRDRATGVILFCGRMMDPSANV
jgi:serpin B